MNVLPRVFSFVKARPRLYRVARRMVRSHRPLHHGEPPDSVRGVVPVGDLPGMKEVARQDPHFVPAPPITIDDEIDDAYQPYGQEDVAFHTGAIANGDVLQGEAVLTADARWVLDVSMERFTHDRDRFPVSGIALRPKRMGRVALLAGYAGTGYFHWMLEVLPRIELFRRGGIDIEDTDTILVNGTYASYQRDTLAQLGIDPSRTSSALRYPRVVAEELLVTSHPRVGGGTPRWVVDFIREAFPAKRPPDDPGKRLYISRNRTHHGRVESDEIDEILERRGFSVVALEDYSLSEKAYLFSNAEVVAGPTGAGLAHSVFSGPGTTIVELNARGIAYSILWDLVGQAGARYAYLGGSDGAVGIEPEGLAAILDLVTDGET